MPSPAQLAALLLPAVAAVAAAFAALAPEPYMVGWMRPVLRMPRAIDLAMTDGPNASACRPLCCRMSRSTCPRRGATARGGGGSGTTRSQHSRVGSLAPLLVPLSCAVTPAEQLCAWCIGTACADRHVQQCRSTVADLSVTPCLPCLQPCPTPRPVRVWRSRGPAGIRSAARAGRRQPAAVLRHSAAQRQPGVWRRLPAAVPCGGGRPGRQAHAQPAAAHGELVWLLCLAGRALPRYCPVPGMAMQ